MRRLLTFLFLFIANTSRADDAWVRLIVPGGGATYTGGAITTPILAPAADNCAAVPYSATGSTTTGMCWSATDAVKIKLSPSTYVSTASDVYVVVNQQLLVGGGSYSHWLGTNKTTMPSGSYFGWNSDAGSAASGTDDLKLYRGAANTLEQQNGTTAQAFWLDNTWAAAGANAERLKIEWLSNVAYVATSKAGTGTARPIYFGSYDDTVVGLMTGGTVRWKVNGNTGELYAGADNTYDIGGAASGRPRNLNVGGIAKVDTYVEVGNSGGYFGIANRGLINWPADGITRLSNYALTNSVRLKSTGAPSVAGSCGTAPSVAGQDTAMVVTTGTGSPTSCAVTFQSTWTTAPVCVASAQTTTTPINVVTTATTVTVSSAALTASEKLYILCVGY